MNNFICVEHVGQKIKCENVYPSNLLIIKRHINNIDFKCIDCKVKIRKHTPYIFFINEFYLL